MLTEPCSAPTLRSCHPAAPPHPSEVRWRGREPDDLDGPLLRLGGWLRVSQGDSTSQVPSILHWSFPPSPPSVPPEKACVRGLSQQLLAPGRGWEAPSGTSRRDDSEIRELIPTDSSQRSPWTDSRGFL